MGTTCLQSSYRIFVMYKAHNFIVPPTKQVCSKRLQKGFPYASLSPQLTTGTRSASRFFQCPIVDLPREETLCHSFCNANRHKTHIALRRFRNAQVVLLLTCFRLRSTWWKIILISSLTFSSHKFESHSIDNSSFPINNSYLLPSSPLLLQQWSSSPLPSSPPPTSAPSLLPL